MSKRNTKSENIRYGEIKQIRITSELNKLLKSKALEQNTNESEIIRQAIITYINRNMNDNEIIHASLVELRRNIQLMSNKLELLALIIMQQTKHWMMVLPNRNENTEEITEINFQDFQNKCFETLKRNHLGLLESWLLDFYENGENN